MSGKFKVSSKPAAAPAPATAGTAAQFAAGAAMVQSQTGGRALKPIRVNFDMDPEAHQRLKMRAVMRGISIAQLVRELIENDLAK
jgi:hypothetical protein